MHAKLLLITLSALAFSSCSTAYKSGQTPDDVYYSPVRMVDEDQDKRRDDDKNTVEDRTIRMRSRDRRWRTFDEDYEYRNSPYNYCTCKCTSHGYYYNPYYYPTAIYSKTIFPVNTTPRMVNLNAYSGFNSNNTVISKTGNTVNPGSPSARTYNNSNEKSGIGKAIRQIFSGSGSKSGSSSSNNDRTYTPSTTNNSSNSSGSSNSSSGSVTRPKRGG